MNVKIKLITIYYTDLNACVRKTFSEYVRARG